MKKLRPDWEKNNSYTTFSAKLSEEKIKGIADSVEKYATIYGKDGDSTVIKIEGSLVILKGEASGIPSFTHPIYHNGQIYIDARAFVTKDGNIKDLFEFQLLRKRALMELAWIEDTAEFGSQFELIIDVFSSWFSGGIAKHLNMDMADGQYLKALAAIYYLHFLHRDMEVSDDETRIILTRQISRACRLPVTMLDDIFNNLGMEDIAKMYNYKGVEEYSSTRYLDDLCTIFNKLTNNVYKLNRATIYTSLTRGAFIAANSPELVAMAIELPPLFFLMVSFAMEKGYQGKTSIGIYTQSVMNKHDSKKFTQFINAILNPSS